MRKLELPERYRGTRLDRFVELLNEHGAVPYEDALAAVMGPLPPGASPRLRECRRDNAQRQISRMRRLVSTTAPHLELRKFRGAACDMIGLMPQTEVADASA